MQDQERVSFREMKLRMDKEGIQPPESLRIKNRYPGQPGKDDIVLFRDKSVPYLLYVADLKLG
jgi:hypothetical protein